jgi:hypothetical protein
MKNILYFWLAAMLFVGCTVSNPNMKQANNQVNGGVPSQKLITKSRFLDNGSSVRVFVSIDANRSLTMGEMMKEFTITYGLYPDHTNKQQLLSSGTITINSENISEDNGLFTVWFDVPKPKDLFTGVALTEIKDLQTIGLSMIAF